MTNKQYYEFPTLKEWTTSIIDLQEKNGLFHIKLEDSAFYPEGGGQPSDFGTIDGKEVIELIENDDEVIHVLKEKPNLLNVECVIDWNRRIDHMQHHSGQHLLSAIIIELYDIPTISFHLGRETVTIDLDTPSLSNEQIGQIERAVYQKILENNEIKTYFVQKQDLDTLNLRKLPKVDENIRIVEITGTDVSACCGTHVRRTGEIGIIKLMKTEKVRQSTRLHFKCGMRAFDEIQKTSSTLSVINSQLNTHSEIVKDKVEQTILELKEAQKEIEKLKESIYDTLATELVCNSSNNMIHKSFPDESVKDLQFLAKIIASKRPSFLNFSSLKENKILLINQGNSSIHCGELIKELLNHFDGKGGGNAKQAQATVESTNDLHEATIFLTNLLHTKIEA